MTYQNDTDPGSPIRTPAGTGPLGSPGGDGLTWADPGSTPTPPDAVFGGAADAAVAGSLDGTGQRSQQVTR